MEDNKAAPSAPPQGGGDSRRPLGVLVAFHLVRISYAFGQFSEPVLARFLTEFDDSVDFLSQGACSRGLVAASYTYLHHQILEESTETLADLLEAPAA